MWKEFKEFVMRGNVVDLIWMIFIPPFVFTPFPWGEKGR